MRVWKGLFFRQFRQPLPAEPPKLVVVPHGDERPASPRILQIRIVQIRPVNGTIVVHGGGNVKVGDLLAVRVADNIQNAAVVHALRAVFRVPDDLVNEIAQVQYESEAVSRCGAFVVVDHAAISVLCALVGVRQLTNTKRTGRESPSAGAVIARPMRCHRHFHW